MGKARAPSVRAGFDIRLISCSVRVPGQGLDEDAGRGVGPALAQHQVGGEVAGGPALAQGGRVRAGGEQRVGERGALGAGEGSHVRNARPEIVVGRR